MTAGILALFFAALSQTQLPFTIDATKDASADFPGAPRVQSFSFAQWKGRWVIIGGRLAGYHSVGGGPAEFLRTDANHEVWVIDTTAHPARTYHASIDTLPALVKDQWAATGQLYFQDGAELYICGGYGEDSAGKWKTFPVISRVNLAQLIDGVMAGHVPGSSVAYAETALVQSTGGQLTKLPDGYFYLVMGHQFEGSYTAFEGQGEHNGEAASQTYLNEIRKLKISADHGGLSVVLADRFQDSEEFHRRDLNVARILSPKGLGMAAYGGVFTPETQLNYSKPVYLFAGDRPVVDSTFEQKMNTYSCPTLLLYDPAASAMYTTFFGGISRYSWDSEARQFVENPKVGTKTEQLYLDGLQWSDQISTIQKIMAAGKASTVEIANPSRLPAFVGTDAIFIPSPEIARASPGTDILDLQSLPRGKTLVGYVYGGIRAFPHRFPYNQDAPLYNAGTVPTKPSEMILEVWVNRN